jgi:DNA-directed RNA polymerase beta subunit
MTPDIIINPNCMPSRMTLGHMFEMFAGPAACMEGKIVDGTAFGELSADDIAAELKKHGLSPDGELRMCDGRTGAMLRGTIFMGCIFYQRLKHMPIDKVHARSRGPIGRLTRQPLEGRSRDGGLRFGEMERDCMIAHGAHAILRDRLMEQSDKFEIVVCEKCGFFAERFNSKNRSHLYDTCISQTSDYYCRYCKSSEFVVPVSMPYGMILLIRELEACHISVRIRISNDAQSCYLEPV